MRFSLEMSSTMTMVPSFFWSPLKSGSTVTLTDTLRSSKTSSASTVVSGASEASTLATLSTSQAFGPLNIPAKAWPSSPFGSSPRPEARMRRPAALQVLMRPSSSSVMTPLLMLWSMLSL